MPKTPAKRLFHVIFGPNSVDKLETVWPRRTLWLYKLDVTCDTEGIATMRSLAKSMCQEWDLEHPSSVSPEDLLNFVYLDEFRHDWVSIFPDDGDEFSLWALEVLIMTSPDGPPVIPGTGGLRKLRFGETKKNSGKSGATRVCYAYFPEHHLVLMVMAYRKSRQANLSADEKSGIKQYLEITKSWLNKHSNEGQ